MRHKEYWDALARLKKNEPTHLPKGSKINKQNVALEAGKANASSIRKGRDFDELIVAIEAAKKPSKKRTQNYRINTLVDENQKIKDLLDIAHAKYLASLHALFKAGKYTVKRPPIEVVKFPEIDNAVRPVLDREKPAEPPE